MAQGVVTFALCLACVSRLPQVGQSCRASGSAPDRQVKWRDEVQQVEHRTCLLQALRLVLLATWHDWACCTVSSVLFRHLQQPIRPALENHQNHIFVCGFLVSKTQEGCGGLGGENPGEFPKAGPTFQPPFSLPRKKAFQQEISDSRSLLEFSLSFVP